MEMEVPKPNIVLLASPGMGHLIPVHELAKRLVTFHSVDVSLFVIKTTSSAAQSQLLQSSQLPLGLRIVELPAVDISAFVTDFTPVVARISIMIRESIPSLQSKISSMAPPPAALVVDLFGSPVFDIACQMNIPKYVFFTTTAYFLALTMYAPTLDHQVEGEYPDLQEPIRIPGCRPLSPDDITEALLVRDTKGYNSYLQMGLVNQMADGLIVNTWEHLESRTLTALREDTILSRIVIPRVYSVGPLVRTEGELKKSSTCECYEWLQNQPKESVLFVSFGSGGTLSQEQMTELAWGLELSQQRFIWVVRPPVKANASATFFSAGKGRDELSDHLPEGFLTRVEGRGVVVPGWAPQVDILKHPSTGGFLSHCGWNSTLESIRNGVPMIAWPLYAEQHLNASMITEDLGVATRPELWPRKVSVVKRDEIEKMVRLLMEGAEGQEMRARMKHLQTGALKAIENGSSYDSLSQLADEWRSIPIPLDNRSIFWKLMDALRKKQ